MAQNIDMKAMLAGLKDHAAAAAQQDSDVREAARMEAIKAKADKATFTSALITNIHDAHRRALEEEAGEAFAYQDSLTPPEVGHLPEHQLEDEIVRLWSMLTPDRKAALRLKLDDNTPPHASAA